MNTPRGIAVGVLLAGLLFGPTPRVAAWAAPVRIEHLSGVVTAVDAPLAIVGSRVAVGDPVRAAVRFDPRFGVDFYPNDPSHGHYGSPGTVRVAINGLTFEINSGVGLDMIVDTGRHAFDVRSLKRPSQWPAEFPIFAGPTLALTFTQEPPLAPPLSLLMNDAPPGSEAFLLVPHATSGLVAARNALDVHQYAIAFTVERVPEPPVWAMISLAVVAALRGSRRA